MHSKMLHSFARTLVNRRASFIAFFAAVCWGHTSRPLAVAVLAWGLTTAISRALLGRHFLGDVVAGVLVGAATTAVVTKVRVHTALTRRSMQRSTPS